MTPEDQRYFDREFKKIREMLEKVIRTQSILMARTKPVLDE